MNKAKWDLSITGFVVALIVVAMLISTMGYFIAEIDSEYDTGASNILDKYNITQEIINNTEEISDSVDTVNEGSGNIVTDFIDIVGLFFSGGWKALKTSFKSFELFNILMGDATDDIPILSFFAPYLISIIIVLLFLGVGAGVLLKWRI